MYTYVYISLSIYIYIYIHLLCNIHIHCVTHIRERAGPIDGSPCSSHASSKAACLR